MLNQDRMTFFYFITLQCNKIKFIQLNPQFCQSMKHQMVTMQSVDKIFTVYMHFVFLILKQMIPASNSHGFSVRNIWGLQYIGAWLQYIGAPKFYFQYSGEE